MSREQRVLHVIFSALFLIFLFERDYFQAKAMHLSGEWKSIRQDRRRLVLDALAFLAG